MNFDMKGPRPAGNYLISQLQIQRGCVGVSPVREKCSLFDNKMYICVCIIVEMFFFFNNL